jgi:site-specific recombinase XerD
LPFEASNPTVKQHLAAIRKLFDYLTTGGILDSNPASSVRGLKYVVRRGKKPVLSAEEARKLLDSIETSTLIGIRDAPSSELWSTVSPGWERRWRCGWGTFSNIESAYG